jgi:hypothetical protein
MTPTTFMFVGFKQALHPDDFLVLVEETGFCLRKRTILFSDIVYFPSFPSFKVKLEP